MNYTLLIITSACVILEIVSLCLMKESFTVSTFKALIKGILHCADEIMSDSRNKKTERRICGIFVFLIIFAAIVILVVGLSSSYQESPYFLLIIICVGIPLLSFTGLYLFKINRNFIARC